MFLIFIRKLQSAENPCAATLGTGNRFYKVGYDGSNYQVNEFKYVDGKLHSQTQSSPSGSETITYIYSPTGELLGLTYNNTDYYYVRNLQGDITDIIDQNGNKVVSYTYDAWGKLLSTTGSLASTLGVANPFRYRSYMYDTETGLYYLLTRYYDPNTGRFLNADGQLNGNFLGLNLYAYCENNPVNYCDPDGRCSGDETCDNPDCIIRKIREQCNGQLDFSLYTNKYLNNEYLKLYEKQFAEPAINALGRTTNLYDNYAKSYTNVFGAIACISYTINYYSSLISDWDKNEFNKNQNNSLKTTYIYNDSPQAVLSGAAWDAYLQKYR